MTFTPRLFLPEVVRLVVEANRPGAYILGNDNCGFKVGYIGRSDSCLQNRLATHNHLYEFDYFVFHYARNVAHAFQLECQLWHSSPRRKLSNVIHPAAPRNSQLECPYCHFARHVNRYLA